MIFGWGKSKSTPNKNSQDPTPEQLKAWAVTVLDRYGELMEKYTMSFADASLLPVDKASMKKAFWAGWFMAEDDEQREAIKVGWLMLHQFQEGVGEKPVGANIDPSADPKEVMKVLGPYLEWVEKTKAEKEADKKEMYEFVAKYS